jgi:hypothetical protein
VTRDYSVQSWFGKRWFSNIVRNIPAAETADYPLPGIQKAAIAAAGPSLEKSFSALKKLVGEGAFVVACDTAYPVLRGAGIEPAGVLSIDCQYLSSFHFVGAVPENAWLFMGLSSPPTLGHLAKKTAFLSGGHPLEQYVRRAWRNLPALDTSGANVAYAAYSLAESLGAQEIEMFGADFSYPCGKAYARGSYLYRYFAKYASRLAPVEAQHSALLYRAPLEKSEAGETWKYETATLRFYREKLAEKKAHHAPAAAFIAPARAAASAREFLSTYKNEIEELSSFDEEGEGIKNIISTILPTAASFRRENPSCGVDELFAMTKEWCVSEISRVLASIE